MLKRVISSNKSASALYHNNQSIIACSYHSSQNLLNVNRRVSVKPTTTTASTNATPSASSNSYKKPFTPKPTSTTESQEQGSSFQIRGSVNSVHLIGTVTSDAIVKEIANGGTFTAFNLVTSERIKKGDNIEELSTFHSIVSFNPIMGKVATRFFKKGTIVSIRGSLKYREVEKDGVKQVHAQIVIDDFNDAKVIYGKFNKE